MRPFLPFATLLGTAFLLGCQEQASSPVGLEGPQFDRPDNAEGECEVGEVFSRGHCHADDGPVEDPLITAGRILFRTATFGGNGRTCETCHRLANNMALDLDFITALHMSTPLDPLFVAEFNTDLTLLEDGGAGGLLRTRGLILENIQGFDADPVFRSPPSLFNLAFTAPYGYNGNVPNLREFTTGAVIQHFPKTLARNNGRISGRISTYPRSLSWTPLRLSCCPFSRQRMEISKCPVLTASSVPTAIGGRKT